MKANCQDSIKYNVSVFSFLKLKVDELPSFIPKPAGKIVEIVKWFDKNGENLIIISELKSGNILEPGYASELYAEQVLVKGKACDIVWRIKDFNYIDADIEYSQGTLKLIDLDGDTVAESSFFYTITSLEKQVIKFMLHTKGKKLAIRGYWKIDIDNGEPPRLDSIIIDTVFNSFNKKFREYALEEWKVATEK